MIVPEAKRLASVRQRLRAWRGGENPPSEKARFLADGMWVMLGQLASAVGLFLGTRLLTELLPADRFGVLSLLMGLMAFCSGVVCVPPLQAALRFYPELAREGRLSHLRRDIGTTLLWMTGLIAVLIVLGGGVGYTRLGVSFWVFALLAALLIAETSRTFETSLLMAARRQRAFALWTGLENWGRPAAAILAVLLLGSTPQAVLFGYLIATAVVLLLFRRLLRRDGTDAGEDASGEAGGLLAEKWRFILPLMPLAVVSYISSLGDRYFIGGMLGLEEAGIYAAAFGLISRPFLLMGGILESTFRPAYFEAVAEEDRQRANKIFRLWFVTTAAGAGLGVLAVAALNKVLAAVLLAPSYQGAAHVMPWIAVGQAALVLAYVLSGRLYARKRTGAVLLYRTVGAGLALLLLPLLIGRMAFVGAAVAGAGATCCECLLLGVSWRANR